MSPAEAGARSENQLTDGLANAGQGHAPTLMGYFWNRLMKGLLPGFPLAKGGWRN